MNVSQVCACQASYGVEDAEYAITQLAQTTMRSEIGKITLDTVFRERELLNIAIVGETLTHATAVFFSSRLYLLSPHSERHAGDISFAFRNHTGPTNGNPTLRDAVSRKLLHR